MKLQNGSQLCVNALDLIDTKPGRNKRNCERHEVDCFSKRSKLNQNSAGVGEGLISGPDTFQEVVRDRAGLSTTRQVPADVPNDQKTIDGPVLGRRAATCGRLPGLRGLTGVTGTGLLSGRKVEASAGCREALKLGLGLSHSISARSGSGFGPPVGGGAYGSQPLNTNPAALRPCLLLPSKLVAGAAGALGATDVAQPKTTEGHAGRAPVWAATATTGAAALPVPRALAPAAAPCRAPAPQRLPGLGVGTDTRLRIGTTAAGPAAGALGSCGIIVMTAGPAAAAAVAPEATLANFDSSCAGDASESESEDTNDDENSGDGTDIEADSGSSCGPGSGRGPQSDDASDVSGSVSTASIGQDADSAAEGMEAASAGGTSGSNGVAPRHGRDPWPAAALSGSLTAPCTLALVVTTSARTAAAVAQLDGTARRAVGARDPSGPPWLMFPRSDRCLRFTRTAAQAIWPQLMAGNTSGRIPVKVYVAEGAPEAEVVADPDGRSGSAAAPAATTTTTTFIPMQLYMRLGGNSRMSLRGFPRWPLMPGLPWQTPLQISASPTGDGALLELADSDLLARHRQRIVRMSGPSDNAQAAAPGPITAPEAADQGHAGGGPSTLAAETAAAASGDATLGLARGAGAGSSGGGGGSGGGRGGSGSIYGAGRGGVLGCGEGPDLVLRVRLSAKSFNSNAYMMLPGSAAQHFFLNLVRPNSSAATPDCNGAAAAADTNAAAVPEGTPGGMRKEANSGQPPLQQQQPAYGGGKVKVEPTEDGVPLAGSSGGMQQQKHDLRRQEGLLDGAGLPAGQRAAAASDGLVRPSAPACPVPNFTHGVTLIPEAWPNMRFQVFLRYRFPVLMDLPPSVCLPRASLGPGAVAPLVLYGALPGDVMELWQRPGGAPGEYLCRVMRSDGMGVRGPPVKRGGAGPSTGAGAGGDGVRAPR